MARKKKKRVDWDAVICTTLAWCVIGLIFGYGAFFIDLSVRHNSLWWLVPVWSPLAAGMTVCIYALSKDFLSAKRSTVK